MLAQVPSLPFLLTAQPPLIAHCPRRRRLRLPIRLPSLASNSKMTKNKKRKVTSTAPSPLPTTIASLPDDVVADILLRLPSAAAICRAVFAYKHWIRVARSPTFLRRLRVIHDYPLLLGHFVAPYLRGFFTPPHFHPVFLRSSESDRLLAAMLRRGDFFSGEHILKDCCGGLLLFSDLGSDAGTLRVFNPTTHRVSCVEPLPFLPRRRGDDCGRTLCLLPNGDDPDAFRVILIQHGKGELARLKVYDSFTRAWRVLSGAGTAKIPARSTMVHSRAMHAGDRIYWKHAVADSLLSLDTKTMTVSDVLLPPGVTDKSAYAVGEAEDGICCLVHISGQPSNRQIQVWRFRLGAHDHEGNGAQMWELERQVPLRLSYCLSERFRLHQVCAIVGGIVLLCFNNSSAYQPHIAFRLKSLNVVEEFACYGLAHPFVIQ